VTRRVLALIAVTAVWGWTFVVVKDAVTAFPVAAFLAYRFVLAAAALAPLAGRLDLRALRVGALIGVAVAAGYLFQTLGLTLTSASDAGILTGLFLVITPLLDRIAFGVRTSRAALLGVALAIPGLVLLVGEVPREVAIGDLLVMAGALCFAAQIVLLSRYASRYGPRSLTLGQIAAAAVIFLALAASPAGGGFPAPSWGVVLAVGITGLLATTVAFLIQTWAQRHLAATPAAVILATEPAWAAFFGVALAHDVFTPARATGAVLLLAAPLAATVLPAISAPVPPPASDRSR
jgi:drug/metabolite transporter (DMT)-like permease